MAYIPIATTTVGSGGSSTIVFSNIPQTHTDLVLVFSCRTDRTGSSGAFGNGTDILNLTFNGSSTGYSARRLESPGSSSPYSSNDTSPSAIYVYQANGSGDNGTSNTFGNGKVYIANYTSSNYKTVSDEGVQEANNTQAFMGLTAGLWSNTAAITSISLAPNAGTTFLQYSTATLYGIRQS